MEYHLPGELFVSYRLALRLKVSFGFMLPCVAYYDNRGRWFVTVPITNRSELTDRHNYCTAPSHQQVIDWLARVHGITVHYCPGKKEMEGRLKKALKSLT
jgi:hypothetical protein